jgi:Dyp-type peroxidase family
MTKLNLSDIQGFVARGYTYPYARFIFAAIRDSKTGQAFIGRVTDHVTTGEKWVTGKPASTLNIAFTYPALVRLGLPEPTLQSFPDEFVEGMRARGRILGDTGKDAPEYWDEIWKRDDNVHVWLSVYGESQAIVDERSRKISEWMSDTGGASVLQSQDAGAIFLDGKPTSKEHFGYTDGFGNPDFEGLERHTIPGQGKLTDDGKNWVPLATGEYLLGYPDEAEELPVSPIPYLLGRNGTFMVYRKLHENVAAFRKYLEETSRQYAGGNAKEKLASKFVGRWRDGTPVELSPDKGDLAIVKDDNKSTNFTYGKDLDGARCPLGAHIRRTNPRDSFGFQGKLVNRRRIMRRGLPYGPYVPEGQPVRDDDDRGILFMALGASLFRQFEFVQQQWVQYGNDAHQGNDKDILLGNHGDRGKFIVQGTGAGNPPFVCPRLPDFVELRGGDYFFLPSITGLRMIASGSVDPR